MKLGIDVSDPELNRLAFELDIMFYETRRKIMEKLCKFQSRQTSKN